MVTSLVERYPTSNPDAQSDILAFCQWQLREGYSKATITERAKALRNLARQLGTLLDGDAVKDLVARVERKPNTKLFWVKTYKAYTVWKGYKWEKPIVQNTGIILPFIQLEHKLHPLTAGP